ncbi:DUF6233 domain-containing protein [Streptomyces roseolus]|uniref:DUF6233 domain-containing protein n=1 Tax=Streptomyces roseolus TaxID=67358 RepID=UPI0037B3D78B
MAAPVGVVAARGLRLQAGARARRPRRTTLAPPLPYSPLQEALGPRQPSGWLSAKARRRGLTRGGVVHAVDCAAAPAGAPMLPLTRALDIAEQPGVRLCSLCGTAPLVLGFGAGLLI